MQGGELFSVENTPKQKSILLSSQSNEWYTPSIYVEAARTVMGSIDLDPASCEEANRVVQATRYYTIEENGLLHPFTGRIWCNPPYGTTNNRSNAALWIRKIIDEYEQGHTEQAIILVNANPDTRWFHQLFAFPVCFTEGRINFYNSKHKTEAAFSRPNKALGHTHGSVFVYLGPNEAKFIEVFSQFGTIVKRVSPPQPKIQPALWGLLDAEKKSEQQAQASASA